MLLCDANHAMSSDTSEIRVIGAGADAAITCLRFSPDRPEPAEKYLRLFCRKADMAIQYVQARMPMVAAQQLTRHREAERELPEKWISVAEYQ